MAAMLLQRSAMSSAARSAAAATTARPAASCSVVCRLQRHAACSSLNNTATPAAAASSLAPASPLQPLQAPLRDLRTASSLRFVVAAESTTVELEVKVEGMKCGGCSSKVEAALKAMDHVKGVQVDLETKLATIEVEAPNQIDAMQMLPGLVATVKELGFEAEPHIDYQAPA